MIISLLFVLVLFFCDIFYEKNDQVNRYKFFLSKESTNSMKVYCSFLIILFHCSILFPIFSVFAPLKLIGKHLVAIFFFISGYGTIASFKGAKDYIKKTLLKYRKIGIMYLVSNVVYWFVFYGQSNCIKEGTNIIFPPCNNTLWYLISIFLFYILFSMIYYLGEFYKWKKIMLVSVTVCSLVIVISTIFLIIYNVPDYWSVSNISMIVGMYSRLYKKELYELIRKNYKIMVVLFFTLCCMFEAIPYVFLSESVISKIGFCITDYIQGNHFRNVCFVLSTMFSTCLVITFSQKLHFKNNIITRKISKMTLEIYVFHMIFVVCFRQIYLNSEINSEIFIALAFICSLLGGAMSNWISEILINHKKNKCNED